MKRIVIAALFAGLCGGLAEIAWIAVYSSATSTNGIEVARQVTASLSPIAADWATAPALGVVIHMVLALALAGALVPFLLRCATPRPGPCTIIAGATVLLVIVWAVNFFLVLPALNPAFVTLLPYGVTLFSKVLFGITMGWVVQETAQPQPSRSL
jgi:hypothetical protein